MKTVVVASLLLLMLMGLSVTVAVSPSEAATDPTVAGLASCCIPGLGQGLNKEYGKGLVMLAININANLNGWDEETDTGDETMNFWGYLGIANNLYSIYDAYTVAKVNKEKEAEEKRREEEEEEEAPLALAPGLDSRPMMAGASMLASAEQEAPGGGVQPFVSLNLLARDRQPKVVLGAAWEF